MSSGSVSEGAKEYKVTVPPQLAGERIDTVLAALIPDFSRSFLQKVIRNGGASVNGTSVTALKSVLKEGDSVHIAVTLPREGNMPPEAENIPLEVLYEDDALLVINKRAGMVVHPAAGNWSGTLVNALAGRYPGMEEEFADADPSRPGIVHRLDKDTSGCLIVARTPSALTKLCESFQSKTVAKTYYAILCGVPKTLSGELVTQMGRHPVDRKKMAVLKSGGREAVTRYEIVSQGESVSGVKACLAKIRILTGRTHQIRVHMAFSGCPVAGDPLYGGMKRIPAPRQMLHARRIAFPHPVTGEKRTFEAPFPEDFLACMKEYNLSLPRQT